MFILKIVWYRYDYVVIHHLRVWHIQFWDNGVCSLYVRIFLRIVFEKIYAEAYIQFGCDILVFLIDCLGRKWFSDIPHRFVWCKSMKFTRNPNKLLSFAHALKTKAADEQSRCHTPYNRINTVNIQVVDPIVKIFILLTKVHIYSTPKETHHLYVCTIVKKNVISDSHVICGYIALKLCMLLSNP